MSKRWLRSVIAALGATTVCFFWIVSPLVSPDHDAVYHWSGAASALFLPSTIDFIIAWALFTALFFVAQSTSRKAQTLAAAIFLFLPWAALKCVLFMMGLDPPHIFSRALFALCAAAFVLFNIFYARLTPQNLARLQRLSIKLLYPVAVYGAFVLLQLVWFGWRAHALNTPQPLHQATNTSTTSPRIIWILLDELSYQQVYEHRFPGLDLPAFDQLRAQSTVFTHVIPAGIRTEIIMPSLITGKEVDETRPASNGRSVKLKDPDTDRWQKFDPQNTVFADALHAGYSTAIAGWYNPYCRLLAPVLDHCFWSYSGAVPNNVLPRSSFARNVVNPLLLSSGVVAGRMQQNTFADDHIADYQQIAAAGDDLLLHSAANFILIHMAVPHPGGIYNRATHRFAVPNSGQNSTYIDNLALADAYLAHVRALLEANGQWDSSAVVVMGDHSWRTELLWAHAPGWTAEEQQASSGGKFDDRPAYVVKLPQQQVGTNVDVPFDAVATRKLLDAILRKQIVSAEDLSRWVKSLPPPVL